MCWLVRWFCVLNVVPCKRLPKTSPKTSRIPKHPPTASPKPPQNLPKASPKLPKNLPQTFQKPNNNSFAFKGGCRKIQENHKRTLDKTEQILGMSSMSLDSSKKIPVFPCRFLSKTFAHDSYWTLPGYKQFQTIRKTLQTLKALKQLTNQLNNFKHTQRNLQNQTKTWNKSNTLFKQKIIFWGGSCRLPPLVCPKICCVMQVPRCQQARAGAWSTSDGCQTWLATVYSGSKESSRETKENLRKTC